MKSFIHIILIISSCWLYSNPITIQTIYGTCTVTNPLICELLQSQAFNRLKGIHQYGTIHYIHKSKYPYTRYTHSVGVFMLLRMYGASEREQIAGLLHDVSHTVFSHVGDHLLRTANMVIDQSKEAYQDEKHLMILAQTDIAQILGKYHTSLASINHKSGKFHMLESELPNICADRLEYNMYGGFAEGWLTHEDIHALLESLHYQDDKWVFDTVQRAKQIALVSIRLCTEIFSTPCNIGSYNATAQALTTAVDKKIIRFNDILFGQDDIILAKLMHCGDPEIKLLMQQALQKPEYYEESDSTTYDFAYIGKFRGLDPWVIVDGTYKRLTEVDPEFNTYYTQAKQAVQAKKYYRCRHK